MGSIALGNRSRWFGFAGFAALVYAVAIAIVVRLEQLQSADAIAFAVTLDLVCLVPTAFYFLILRPAGHSPLRAVPALLLSFLLASRLLPQDRHLALNLIEILLVPCEFALLGWIGWRAARVLRDARAHPSVDPLEAFRGAAMSLLKNDRLARVFASEIGTFFYALASWRMQPHAPSGSVAFSHHRRCGHGGIVLGFLFLLLAEGFAVHLLLSKWSEAAAWIFTASSILGGIWMVGDFRATILRPILLDGDRLQLRAGLRHGVKIGLDEIETVVRRKPENRRCLSLVLAGSPTHWILLNEPVRVSGMYGLSRRADAIGIYPDDVGAFEAAILAPES